MTTETQTAPLATAAPAAPVAGKPRPGIDPRYIAPIFISIIVLTAHFTVGTLESPWKTVLAIVSSILTEMVLGRLITGKVPHLSSAYVSGISVGILVRSPYFWPYALCSIISIMSKYVLRMENRHLWNPSNFGIAAMLVLAPQAVASLSIQFGNSVGPLIVIWILGAIIVSRLHRLHICAAYVLSFLAFAGLRTLVTHQSFWAEVAPITGPMYQLFTFFMITDPRTTVSTKRGQIVVAILVAAAECVFRLFQSVHAPYFALFLVGPTALTFELLQQRKAKRQAAIMGNAQVANGR